MEPQFSEQAPSRSEIEAQLGRILASPQFVNADRMVRFLRFIVTAVLEGEAERLKESVIGVEVFDRPPGYDPKGEPIVRTEARRLRSKLDSYYETAGRDDTIRVSVPRGAYVPAFEVREAPKTADVPAPRSSRWPWIAAAAGLLIVALLAVGPRPNGSAGAPPPMPRRLTAFPGREESPSFSPDGTRFAFAWNGEQQDRFDIYIGSVAPSGSPVRFTSSGSNLIPHWSPDGKWIAWWRDENHILVKGVEGGPERSVFEADYSALSWSPDSRHIILTRHQKPHTPYALFLGSVDSGAIRQITVPPAGGLGDLAGVISPDGTHLAFQRCLPEGCDLFVQPSNGGDPRRLTHDRTSIFGMAWTPDNRELVFASRRRSYAELWRVRIDGKAELRLFLPSLDDLSSPAFAVARSQNQWLLAYQRLQFDSNIWTTPLGTARDPRRLIASTRADNSPRYSPDGGRMAFISDRNGHSELWVAGADGRNETVLASLGDDHLGSPRWSFDGRRIAFDDLKGNLRAIFVIDAAGSAPRRVTQWAEVGRPSWSADGRWIYFFRRQDTGLDIWRVPADSDGSSAPVQVTHGGGFEGYESSDGQQFYYVTRNRELWRLPVAGGSPERVLATTIWHGWWQLRDDGVAFADMTNAQDAAVAKPVYFYTFQSRQQRKIAELPGNLNPNDPDFHLSPDFQQIAFGRFDAANADIEMIVWPGK